MNRRHALAGGLALLAAGAGLVGCSGQSSRRIGHRGQPTTPVTMLTGFHLLGQDSYLYLGKQRGYFTEVGIDLKVVPGKGTGYNLGVLAAGKADLAVVDLSGAIVAHGIGNTDFTTIAAIYQRSVSTITALAGTGITTPADLSGRRIGFQPGGVNHTLFGAYARLTRPPLDGRTVRWVQGQPALLRSLLATGKVDAITETVIGAPGVQAAAGGRATVELRYSDVMADLYGNVIVTSRKTAAQRTDLVRRFRQAVIRSLNLATDFPDEAGQAFHQAQPHYKAEVAAAETRLMAPYARAGTPADTGRIDPGRVARSIALLASVGAVRSGVEPPHVVDFGLADPGSN